MSEEVFDFDAQLEIGNVGEAAFKKRYATLLPTKSKDRRVDFVLADGSTVELKTDTYDMDRTPNFFMEMFGNVDEGAIGGPWRAMQDGVTYFVYYFARNKMFFWFETIALCKALDSLIASGLYPPREVRNKGWIARGYAIPRKALEGVLLKQES